MVSTDADTPNPVWNVVYSCACTESYSVWIVRHPQGFGKAPANLIPTKHKQTGQLTHISLLAGYGDQQQRFTDSNWFTFTNRLITGIRFPCDFIFSQKGNSSSKAKGAQAVVLIDCDAFAPHRSRARTERFSTSKRSPGTRHCQRTCTRSHKERGAVWVSELGTGNGWTG